MEENRREKTKQFILGIFDDISNVSLTIALIIVVLTTYVSPIVQRIIFGGQGTPITWTKAFICYAVAAAFFSIANERHGKSSATYILSCPQGVLAYRFLSIIGELNKEMTETKIKEMLAANPRLNPANYEDSLHIKVIRFDATPSNQPPPEDSIFIGR
jgi:hypothetical protein